MRDDTRRWIHADQAHCWHPFTRQGEWCAPDHEPLVLVRRHSLAVQPLPLANTPVISTRCENPGMYRVYCLDCRMA